MSGLAAPTTPAPRRSACAVVALFVAGLLLAACTESGSAERTERPPPTQSPKPTPSIPTPSGPVAGTRAALAMLEHPDLRPHSGYVSENGDVLVRWSLTGVRVRDAYRCRHPVVLTWVPHPAWRGGVRPSAVRAWLLADGMRDVLPTRAGFYLSRSHCDVRAPGDQAPALGLDHQGHVRAARTSSAIEEPREGAIRTKCGPPRGGNCQFDPATNTLSRLPWRHWWIGTWDEQRSTLWGVSSHISGTWSGEGGSTWNQFIDVWDATPLRRGAATVAVSNGVMSTGSQSSYGELTGGSFREGFL